jgi:hypothetical protein
VKVERRQNEPPEAKKTIERARRINQDQNKRERKRR